MKIFEKFKKDYKRDVLVRVIQGLKSGSMSRAESRYFAKVLLSLYSETDEKSVMIALSKLSQVKDDILEVYIKRGGEYNEMKKIESLQNARLEIKTLNKLGGEN